MASRYLIPDTQTRKKPIELKYPVSSIQHIASRIRQQVKPTTTMAVAKIIWVDDEIESLQSQKLFLENKGYEVQTFTNGFDAIDYIKENPVDCLLYTSDAADEED